VEDIFRTIKSILDTRPIYHQKDAAIRGHVFRSFLPLVLPKRLEEQFAAARSRLKSEWGALLMNLDRLLEIENRNRARGQARHPARCRSRLPGRRRRAAAQHPGGRRRRINPLNSIRATDAHCGAKKPERGRIILKLHSF
jgi:hypothetical protein